MSSGPCPQQHTSSHSTRDETPLRHTSWIRTLWLHIASRLTIPVTFRFLPHSLPCAPTQAQDPQRALLSAIMSQRIMSQQTPPEPPPGTSARKPALLVQVGSGLGHSALAAASFGWNVVSLEALRSNLLVHQGGWVDGWVCGCVRVRACMCVCVCVLCVCMRALRVSKTRLKGELVGGWAKRRCRQHAHRFVRP